jgi:hypothetical protein
VRAALDAALDTASLTVKTLSDGLRVGTVPLAVWQEQMAQAVKSTHLAAAALARGGWAQMDARAYGAVGREVRTQYEFLRNFAADIASGKQPLDGSLPRRAELYIQAGRMTYYLMEQREQARLGRTEERNIRAASDSCDGCLAASALGWVAIGTLPPVGARDCLTRCRCSVEYR